MYLSCCDSFEAYEPNFEDEEPEFEPQDPDDHEYPTSTAALTPGPHGTEDPDAQMPNGLTNGATTPGRTVVEVNGDGGQQQVKKNAVLGLKEKKIDDDKRTTTPYMTKYERARVLGTRALQIRYVEGGRLRQTIRFETCDILLLLKCGDIARSSANGVYNKV